MGKKFVLRRMEKKMNMKQTTIAIMMSAALAAALFASGGGQQGGGTPAGTVEKPTLVIGSQANSFITDYENNYLTQYLEKLHNVNLDFYRLPSDGTELLTKISLMVSANDLPDILLPSLSPETVLDYGNKGAFISLNKYLNDPARAPNWAAIPAEHRIVMERAMTMADGNIYSLCNFEPQTWNFSPYRMYMNKTWLDRLGLKIPSTTDELRTVLQAFRDKDPNGNGRKDEIGLYGNFNGGYGENIILALINAFIFYNNNLSLDGTGKMVTAPFADPAFRKALVYLNGLYRETLFPASLFTDNTQQFRAVINNDPNIVGMVSLGSYSHYPNARENPNFLEMVMVPPFTGPDGVCYTPYSAYEPYLTGMIASKCRNPDKAFQVIESFFNSDIEKIGRWGEEGADWTRAPEELAKHTNIYVAMGFYPSVTLLALKDNWAAPTNKHWHDANPRYSPISANDTTASAWIPYDPNQPLSQLNGLNYQMYINKWPVHILPRLKYTGEEGLRIAEYSTVINDYVKQSISEFVIGVRDINSDAAWNAYLRELENMRLHQWLSGAQATFNRMK
jgi:putative aldouronate transport system substrate-binding protein